MPVYPELIGLIDLIEENVDRNCRFLRVLRDLFNNDPAKREFATGVLSSSLSRDIKTEQDGQPPIKDLLAFQGKRT